MDPVITPHPFQGEMIDATRAAVARGARRVIVQASTGAGKTIIGGFITRAALAKGRRTLWLCHTRELVDQAVDRLADCGVNAGVIMAGEDWAPSNVQVASKDTLVSRAVRRGTMDLPAADLVISDEAHLSLAPRWLHLMDKYVERGALVLGLTATPSRANGKGMGDWWQGMVQGPPTSKLIEMGMLVPCMVKAPKPTKDKAQLVGDIIKHWQMWASDRQTVVFADSVSHSMHIRDLFVQAGIKAQHLDGDTDIETRKRIIEDTASGANQIVVTCGMLTHGWDDKRISCCVLARIVKSFVLLKQMLGRILRKCDGKRDALLIDHGGAIYEHGYMPDDDVDWDLAKSGSTSKQLKKKPKDKLPTICPSCFSAFVGTNKCPACGFEVSRQPKITHNKAGMLFDVNRADLAKHQSATAQRYWDRCLGVMAHKGRTAAAAVRMFHQQFLMPPWTAGVVPLPGRDEYSRSVADLFPQYAKRKA